MRVPAQSYNSNEVAIGPGVNPVACDAVTGVCTLSGFTPAQPPADRRRLFFNGVPAFTYPGFTYTNAQGVVLPTPPCCAVDTSYYGNDADNKYNALQVKAEKRISSGLQFLAHYTFSHAYAYDSSYYSVNKKVAWGPNPYNRNQVFVANAIYELPVGTGKKFMSDAGRAMNLIVGGWQVTNTLTYGTGLPFTPSIAECGAISDAGPCRPNLLSNASNISTGVTNSGGNTYWFTPVAPLSYGSALNPGNASVDSCTFARPASGPYSLPGCGQIGNAGFNSMRGPHAFYDDMALSKTFIITERFRAQFRFDAYNVFNHPVLAVPGNTCVDCAGNSNAGQITDIEADSAPGSPVGMRQLQFGVRLTF